MVRPMLTEAERARGIRLGETLRDARGDRPATEVAAASGVPVDTLRKIESGRIPTPAFFTVVALARALDLPIERLLDLDVPTAAEQDGADEQRRTA
ncbi:helix-turn-helix transcriptional regulator [Nakamurella flava]|uniref:Helix-turn-helix transcriptional regulator n=1 Tax=Nakamurella flava TaxID=2576308 RepID=A0A4U6QF60_9ACTN|nr:helix-turn-helix transcriptional regulator [Nakamurella flava]TKV58780.1 helix-turn-helix transcriptional regulator [Nakamurella flava]